MQVCVPLDMGYKLIKAVVDYVEDSERVQLLVKPNLAIGICHVAQCGVSTGVESGAKNYCEFELFCHFTLQSVFRH